MATYACTKGHQSSESDFCSECGMKIGGASSGAGVFAGAASAGTTATCPDCGAPRADFSSNFCEVCGYNYSTGTHGNVPVSSPSAGPCAAPPPLDNAAAVVEDGAAAAAWMVTAVVDPTLRDPEGPEPPADAAPVTVKLEKDVTLIGRKSEKRGIFPEVSLDEDDGVSHRHALLTRGEDGGMILRDIGSANGTRLNGADVQPLADVAVHDGDQITLGRWTRLTLKSV